MPRSPDSARANLISAGERLFAERGIDNVSLREISRASGARNVVALQHHFGDREGLLTAILQKHRDRVGGRRHVLLDAYELAGRPDLEAFATALVEPLAACLVDEDGGRDFLQIWADLVVRPRPTRWLGMENGREDSMERWRRLGDPLLASSQKRVHRRYSAVVYVVTELARRAQDPAPFDVEIVANQTIDVVMSILSAPVRAKTASLLELHTHQL